MWARIMTTDRIQTEAELEEVLTRPRAVLVEWIRQVASPLVILGAGGKMGATLAVLARRAAEAAGHPLEIVAVSRFPGESTIQWLEGRGVRTWRADLLEREQVRLLPPAASVIYLVGLKFGTARDPSLTWAVNALAPALTAEQYGAARLVALSTGNVYPYVPADSGGATEGQGLTPLGEYANAAVARERVFEYFSRKQGTPVALLRLNYAVELRYGVLVDIARKVWTGEPVDVSNGWFNCIWQGDANETILRAVALSASPPAVFNLTGPAVLSVRQVATTFSRLLKRPARFTGEESNDALLSNPAKLCAAMGPPPTPPETMMRWVAHWVQINGRHWDKPTHFEVRDGRY